MKLIKTIIVLAIISSSCLWAGKARQVKENTVDTINTGISVDAAVSQTSKDKLAVTVTFFSNNKNSKSIIVRLIHGDVNKKIEPTVKGKYAKASFEVDKKDLKDGRLYITYGTGKSCPESYFIKLNEYKKVSQLIVMK